MVTMKPRSRYPMIGALAVIMLAPWASHSAAVTEAFPGTNGKIVFVSDRDGDDEIYTMNAGRTREDVASLRQLTHNSVPDRDPVFSSDGSKIAFASLRDDNWDVFTMNADGTEEARITEEASGEFQPSFAPGFSRPRQTIVFTSTRDVSAREPFNHEVYRLDPESARLAMQLTFDPELDTEPAWSPTECKIAFSSKRSGGNRDIFIMGCSGLDLRRLTTSPASDSWPAFSPDGKKIAFQSNRSGNTDIHVMNADGTGQERVTNDVSEEWQPAFSPDGAWIVFTSWNRLGSADIYTRRLDGTAEVRITSGPRDGVRNTQPDWQPVPSAAGGGG
ncbi:DPP IV N-terminal domain-containing protein [Streptomyces sp. 2P-4]|uniref:DPP IV N-terminal domain-containing protein n=1 Tax=Streptomyces sp. 2P-4 TaxID=2931974 RepID=UPI002540034B|nr:DPP IV N-terminal domain-containing protein [Streptomyces sp. 2P-4]